MWTGWRGVGGWRFLLAGDPQGQAQGGPAFPKVSPSSPAATQADPAPLARCE